MGGSWHISECKKLQLVHCIASDQLGYPWLPSQSGHPGKSGLHINCLGHGSAAVRCNSLGRILSPHPAFLIWTPLFVGWKEISLTSGSNQMHPPTPHHTGHGDYQKEARPLKFQKKNWTTFMFCKIFGGVVENRESQLFVIWILRMTWCTHICIHWPCLLNEFWISPGKYFPDRKPTACAVSCLLCFCSVCLLCVCAFYL